MKHYAYIEARVLGNCPGKMDFMTYASDSLEKATCYYQALFNYWRKAEEIFKHKEEDVGSRT